MKIKHLKAKKNKVYRNKFSELLYKEIITYEDKVKDWEEIDIEKDMLFSESFSDVESNA